MPKLKKGTRIRADGIAFGKIDFACDVEGVPGYGVLAAGETEHRYVRATEIEVITKPKKVKFETKLAELSAAYKLMPTSLVMTQVLDLGVDLSKERPEEVFTLLMQAVREIQATWDKYGAKPNVLVDSQLKNALVSTRTTTFEYGIMFWANLHTNGVRWKNKPQDFEFDNDQE